MYGHGVDFDEISDFYHTDAKALIKDAISESKQDKEIKEELAKAVANKIEGGSSRAVIYDEIGFNHKRITNMMKEFGLSPKKPKGKGKHESIDDFSVLIDWDRMDKCPTCGAEGTKVRDVSTQAIEESFCMDCSTEWLKKGKRIRQIVWHDIEE